MECRTIQQKRWFQNIGFKVVKVMFRGGVCKFKDFTILSEFLPFFSIQCILVKHLFRDWSLSIFFVSSGLFSTLKRGLAFPLISAGAINSGSIISSFFWYRDSQVLFQVCVIYIVYPCFIDRLTTWVESFQCSLVFTDWAPISYPKRANHCHILRFHH